MVAPTEQHDLTARLVHLTGVEGYGRGYGLAPALRPAWARAAVPSIAVSRTLARLRALALDDAKTILDGCPALSPVVGDLVTSAMGEPPWPEPLGPSYSPPVAVASAEAADMNEWIRRLQYLVREEGLSGDKVRALGFSDAAVHLLRHVAPGPAAYLLDAAASAIDPRERAAFLHLARHRYATLIMDGDDDEALQRRLARELQEYSGESAGVEPDVIGRLVARGTLPNGFVAPVPSPALAPRKDPP